MAFTCPHCGSVANTRSSRYLSDLTQEEFLQCSNCTCGHTFTTFRTVRETLSPPAIPKAGIHIPQANRTRLAEVHLALRKKSNEDQIQIELEMDS